MICFGIKMTLSHDVNDTLPLQIQNFCVKNVSFPILKNSFIELSIADAVFDKLYEVLGLREIWMNIL